MRVRSPIKQHAKLTYTEILIPRTSFTTSSALSSRVRTFICTRDFFIRENPFFRFPLHSPTPSHSSPSVTEHRQRTNRRIRLIPPPPSLPLPFLLCPDGGARINLSAHASGTSYFSADFRQILTLFFLFEHKSTYELILLAIISRKQFSLRNRTCD